MPCSSSNFCVASTEFGNSVSCIILINTSKLHDTWCVKLENFSKHYYHNSTTKRVTTNHREKNTHPVKNVDTMFVFCCKWEKRKRKFSSINCIEKLCDLPMHALTNALNLMIERMEFCVKCIKYATRIIIHWLQLSTAEQLPLCYEYDDIFKRIDR